MAKSNKPAGIKTPPKSTVSTRGMKSENLLWIKSPYFYLLTLGMLLIIALAYYSPSLSGKGLSAHDFLQGITSTKELTDYHNSTGKVSSWTGTMFSGMPAYQVWYTYENIGSWIIDFLYKIPSVYIYISVLVIFSSFLLFYVMKLHPLIAFTGGVGLLLSNFSIVGLMAGHNNKVMVIALVPGTLAGIWLIYEQRKYLAGLFIVALTIALQLRSNHFQITYFMFFLVGMWTLVNLIFWIKEKEMKHAILSVLLLVLGVGIGAASNTVQLWATQEYSAETQRGGPSPVEAEMTKKAGNQVTSSGVDYEYATAWCYGKLESLTLLIPNFAGGASQSALDENSNVYGALVQNGVQPMQAIQFSSSMPTYWGPQPFTAGTTYMGAVLIYLMILAFVLLDGRKKWWLISTLLVTLFISWGKHFDTFYRLLFDYLPFFNKFRTPTMIFYLTSIVIVVSAVLVLQELFNKHQERELLWKKFLYTSGGVLGFMVFMTLLAPSIMSFQSQTEPDRNVDEMFKQQLLQATQNNTQFADSVYSALLDDRKSMMQKDAMRSTFFILLAIGFIALYLRRMIPGQVMLLGVSILVLADLWGVDSRYINADKFTDNASSGINGPVMTEADRFILQDKDPSYRVLDLTVSTFNEARTSYFHKSIGGYHSAKLKRYQDFISYLYNDNIKSLSEGRPQDAQAFNMLNMRYVITTDQASGVIKNPEAYGNAWLVDSVVVMNGPVEVFKNLNARNLKKVALLEKSTDQVKDVLALQKDSSASIRLEKYSPEILTYTYKSATPSYAVFSEIYYNDHKGWVAYLDGNKVAHEQVNYLLRGMSLPAGEHTIEFKFEPASVVKGAKLDIAASLIILLLGAGAAYQWYLERKKAQPELASEESK